MDQLSYISSPPNRVVRYMTVIDKLKEQAYLNPNKEIFIFYSLGGDRESITFAELYKESVEFSKVLMSLGVKKGDNVVMHLQNSMEWLIIGFGLMAIGAIPVGSYISQHDASDIDYVLDKTEAVAIFFSNLDSEVRKGIKRLVEQNSSRLKFAVPVDIEEDDDTLFSYNDLRKTDSDDDLMSDVCLDPDDVAIIMRSSGTAGRSKFISHSHLSLQKMLGMPSKDVDKIYSNAEFSWLGGTPVANIFSGVSKVTICAGMIPVTTGVHLDVIEEEGCSAIFLTADVLNRILKDNQSFPTCVNAIVLAGSHVKKKYRIIFDQVSCLISSYASLETGAMTFIKIDNSAELDDNIGGYAFPGVEIKVTDDRNQTVMRGTKGKIFARRDYPFGGYYGEQEMAKNAVTPSGWYETGDIGYISRENKLFVIGRNCEWISRGTITVHVTAIEYRIMALNIPEVDDVVAVSVPDDIYGEEVCACVILKKGHDIPRDSLLQVFRNKIQRDVWRPKYVVFMDYFPTNVNGKLTRKQMTEHAIKTLKINK